MSFHVGFFYWPILSLEKACDRCATACEAFPNDEHMKSCAEECRECEKACKAMTEHMASK
jgi:hypothetical protein